MMLRIYEYIFYRCYLQYQKWGEKQIPGVYAICVVLILQEMNVFSLFLLGLLWKEPHLNGIVGYYLALFFLVFFVFDYIYIYRIKGVTRIVDRFADNKREDQRIRMLSLLYAVFSILFFVCLMVQRVYF